MLEALTFVKPLLMEPPKEVFVLLDNNSAMEVAVEEEAHGADEQGGAFSSFSTSLCSLDVSDVGVGVAMEEGNVLGVEVCGPEALGK